MHLKAIRQYVISSRTFIVGITKAVKPRGGKVVVVNVGISLMSIVSRWCQWCRFPNNFVYKAPSNFCQMQLKRTLTMMLSISLTLDLCPSTLIPIYAKLVHDNRASSMGMAGLGQICLIFVPVKASWERQLPGIYPLPSSSNLYTSVWKQKVWQCHRECCKSIGSLDASYYHRKEGPMKKSKVEQTI